jgi:DNA-binding CsgD family transcriptional regulator
MLVGREDAVGALAEALQLDRPTVVTGEAGVGKTALLEAVVERSRRRGWWGGAYSTLSWMHLLPLRRALGRHLSPGDAAATADQVERLVGSGVLVLDDLQWADDATLEVVDVLAGRIALMGAVRTGGTSSNAVVDRLRSTGFLVLDVEPLSVDDSGAVVRALRPDLGPARVERLVHSAGGNPLLLHELSATGDPPESLRVAVAARLRRLDATGREAFNLLALAGRPMRVHELGDGAAKDLVEVHLARTDGDSVTPRHALMAEVAGSMLSSEQRAALHARLARLADDPGEAARHHELAGERDAAHQRALLAARAADRPGEEASHLAVAARTVSGPDADLLLLEAARALERAEDRSGVEEALARISSDDPEIRGWTALLRSRAAWYRGDEDAVRAEVEAGLARVAGTDSAIEVRLRIEAARVPIFVESDWDRGLAEARAALEMARRLGVEEARAEYLLGTVMAQVPEPGWVEQLEGAIERARREGDIRVEMAASNNLISGHESDGSQAEARRLAIAAATRARSLGLEYWARGMRALLVNLDFHAGEYASAIDEAEALLGEPLDARSRDAVAEMLILSLTDTGRFERASVLLDSDAGPALPDRRGQARLWLARAECRLWSGRYRQALVSADAGLAEMAAGDGTGPFVRIVRGWAALELGIDPGEPIEPQPLAILRAVPHEAAGQRLLHVGDPISAVAEFDQAASLWHGYHVRGELRCRWAAADAMRRAGELGAAVARLEAVERSADARGMTPLLSRIRRSLRSCGVHRSPPVTSRSDGAQRLTAREREVLALVSEGLTNPEIAARLGLSRRTIETHIASASSKLDATTRSQAAALAHGWVDSSRPPLIVVDVDAGTLPGAMLAAREEVTAAGWPVVDGLSQAAPGVVCVVALARDTAERALLSAMDGGGLVVAVSGDRDLADSFCDDLRHIGPVDHRLRSEPEVELSDDERRLLGLLLDGGSLGAAAAALHISRRTADRRLASARRALGADSTSAALSIARRRGLVR